MEIWTCRRPSAVAGTASGSMRRMPSLTLRDVPRVNVAEAHEQIHVRVAAADPQVGGQGSRHREIGRQVLARVRQHVAAFLAAALRPGPGVAGVEGSPTDPRRRIGRVVSVPVRWGGVGLAHVQAAAWMEVPALDLGGGWPVRQVHPSVAAHHVQADAIRPPAGRSGLQVDVEPVERVSDAGQATLGTDMGPRPDRQSDLPPGLAEPLVVAYLLGEEDVEPAADERGRGHAVRSPGEVERLPPGVARQLMGDPVLVEVDAVAVGQLIRLAQWEAGVHRRGPLRRRGQGPQPGQRPPLLEFDEVHPGGAGLE